MAVKLRKRNGKWWVYIDHKGRRKAKCIGVSKSAAEQVARKIEAKLNLGDVGILEEKPARPFDAYCQRWLTTYVKTHCKDATASRYESVARLYLFPLFGSRDIEKITREDIKGLVYDLYASGKSTNTVKGVLTPIRALFSHAVEDGHLTVNPCANILRRTRKPETEPIHKADFLTREEVTRLLETCREHFPRHYPFFLLLARTGLRLGEAMALRWDDIDVHNRFLTVQRSFSDGRMTTPKNGRTRRVDMSQQLTATLQALLMERKKETLQEGWRALPPWIFTTTTGTLLNEGSFRYRVWRPLLQKAGLRQIRMHDLRHTFASLLIQQGESLVYVKEQLGHHSIKLTVDTYGHLIPGGNKAAVDRLDELEPASIRNPTATTDLCTLSQEHTTTRKRKRKAA